MTKPAKLQTVKEKTALGYGAIDSTTNRRNPITKTSGELFFLSEKKREIANATVRDDRRNFTVLAWMIRRHLDNVSRFTHHIRTGKPEVDTVVKKLLNWHAKRTNFDAIGRHSRDEWLRMFEACKVINGDVAGIKSKFGRLQGIEGERIARPKSYPKGKSAEDVKGVTEEGIIFNSDGTRKSFCICKRSGDKQDGLEFERIIPSSDVIFDAYWPERFDSNRGVSPLLTALNEGADVRETREWLVLKAKASALFGLAFTRTSSDEMLPSTGENPTDAPATEGASYSAQLAAGVKSRGLINLDLDPGDSVTEIESKTPNPQIVEFTRELIRSVLLALDIPFTFYDSLTASFSARIADRNEYEESCEWKRDKNISVLDDIYGQWLLPMWAESNLFSFGDALKTAGISVQEVAASLRWVPAGRPWLDRSNEMSGHILALAAGTTSTPRICSAYGDDAYEIAQEQKEYLEKAGIPLLYAQGGQFAVQSIMDGIKKPEETNKQGANPWLT